MGVRITLSVLRIITSYIFSASDKTYKDYEEGDNMSPKKKFLKKKKKKKKESVSRQMFFFWGAGWGETGRCSIEEGSWDIHHLSKAGLSIVRRRIHLLDKSVTRT